MTFIFDNLLQGLHVLVVTLEICMIKQFSGKSVIGVLQLEILQRSVEPTYFLPLFIVLEGRLIVLAFYWLWLTCLYEAPSRKCKKKSDSRESFKAQENHIYIRLKPSCDCCEPRATDLSWNFGLNHHKSSLDIDLITLKLGVDHLLSGSLQVFVNWDFTDTRKLLVGQV